MITGQKLAVTSPSSSVEPAYNYGQCLKNVTGYQRGLHALSPLNQSININTYGNDLTAANSAMILKYSSVKNSRMPSPSNKHKRYHTSYQ